MIKKIVISLSLFVLFAQMSFGQSFTNIHGKLQLVNNQLCDQFKKPIQLRGFSAHNLTYCPECTTFEALQSQKEFWGANVFRAAMYTDDWWNKNSYNKNKPLNIAFIDSVVNWTEQLGLYCIIDWHILTQGNPNAEIHKDAANFFKEVSKKYANKKHILYEICNEPNGANVNWDTIAEYANKIIPIIRKNDAQAIIIVGTPQWCQLLETVKPELLNNTYNIMYAFHFYATTHANLFPMFIQEIHRIPVFASEWGVCENTGNGNINFEKSDMFVNAMKQHIANNDTISISWCNFSFGDKKEAASCLQPESCKQKKWTNITPPGFYIREVLQTK